MSLLLSKGYEATKTPAIPRKIDNHSNALTLLFDKKDDIKLINNGFNAMASAVMPAVIY